MASEVFTPTSFPKHTYVQRDDLHHERLLVEWARGSTHLSSISGPSKAGKTVLVQRVIGKDHLITVSGASVRVADQLWDRVLDWVGEPHSMTAGTAEGGSDAHNTERAANLGLAGLGASTRSATTTGTSTGETTSITSNRRGLPQVVAEIANSKFTLLLDDFHYIPAAIQGDVAQQLKDAASRGVRICTASVPHRADNVVRALPELRGRVFAIDIDYWSTRDLLEIPRLGCAALDITVDKASLKIFAEEAAGSPQLMQSICLWMCSHMKVLEGCVPPRALELDANARKEILFLASCTVDFRTLVDALIAGPKARPDQRRAYKHRDGRQGDVYLTVMRALAMDPPRLRLDYAELGARLDELCNHDGPEGASVIRTLGLLDQIAKNHAAPTGPSLEWDERDQIVVVPDPYLLFYLRWSGMLERVAEA